MLQRPAEHTPAPRRLWLRVYAGDAERILGRMRGPAASERGPLAGLGLWITARWSPPHSASKHSIAEVGRLMRMATDRGIACVPGAVLDPLEWNDLNAWQARQRWLSRLEPWIEHCGALALDTEQYTRQTTDPRRVDRPTSRQMVATIQEALAPLAEWANSIQDLICYPATHRGGGVYTAAAALLGADSLGDERTLELCRAIKRGELAGSRDEEQRAANWRDYFRAAYEFAGASQRRYLPGILSSILKPGRQMNLDFFDGLIGEPRDCWVFLDDEATFLTPQWFTEQPRPVSARPRR